MLITRTSIFSRITRTLDLPVTEDQILAYENGALLHDAFPNLTAEEREFCKTGMTTEEWNQLFSEQDPPEIPEQDPPEIPEQDPKQVVRPELGIINQDIQEALGEKYAAESDDKPIQERPEHLSMFEWRPEDILRREILEIDSISEFGAKGLHVSTEKQIVGLKRWTDKQYMVSFFPTNIEGNRFQYQSKIDKVYDLFLTEEQVELIVSEYNKRNGIFSE